ncbi:MAG: nitrilase-related carbon-nitrogen hydrolase [Desulfobacteraceae bacterium]|jgi:predicted amidohydrolase
MKSLKLALVHLDIRHQKTEANRKALLDLIRQGADQGAQLIVTPEMAISGYSLVF